MCKIILLLSARLLLIVLFSALVARAADYAGSASCRSCHPAQSDAQSKSAHANALAPSKKSQPGDWAFGAGEQAITFVRRLDRDHYMEEPQTWYRSLNGYARTPGHTTPNGVRDRIFDPEASILRCFACHSTGPLRVTATDGILPREAGVRCEACHGPSSEHVQNPARIKPVNPARFSANQINSACGACHRMPAKEHDETNLRDPWNVRHQPLMLAASRCFMKSAGKLSCLSCHDPHNNLQRDPAVYTAVCSGCHPSVGHKAAILGKTCVECHMPNVQPQPHLVFRNHRIGIYNANNPVIPISAVTR